MARSKIEWLARPGTIPESWNPVTGCNIDGKRIKASPGCDHCWAERMARRLAGRFGYPEAPHHFDVTLHPDRLDIPLYWKKPRTVFVCSMGDLFHNDVPADYINSIVHIMKRTKQHTFLILTKRPQQMLGLTNWLTDREGWPSNVWLGVSVENQETADERIPLLLQTPAAVRFVSCEPLLGLIDLKSRLNPCKDLGPLYTPFALLNCEGLDWVIVGGESGPGARPMHPDWARSLRDQCQATGVPFFFKQWGAWSPYPPEYDIQGRCETTILPERNQWMWRIGKHRAGRLLDGREWNEWPE